MNKKISILVAISILVTTMFGFSAFAATANPTASTVLVNGSNVAFDAYNIADNNYFKLRDLAFTLSGAPKQFEVGWDGANNAISLTSGQSYTVVGGEMTGKGGGAKEATPTDSRIYLNGREVQFTAYNIDGNNYFKLRDIGEAFDFGVDWDGDRNTIAIDTSKGYSLDGGTTIPVTTPVPTPTPAPTSTPEPSTSPSGENNPNLVGTWRGSLNGVERYYEFKVDGTFMGRVYSDSGGSFANQVGSARNLLIKGNWMISERKIYFSETYYFSWAVGSTPPDKIDWYKGADDAWTIETGQGGNEVDVIGYDRNARWIKVLEFVYVTPDGSLPDAYLVLVNSALPSWAFPAGMAPIEADPNDKYVPISLDSSIIINTTYNQQNYYFVFTTPTAGTYSFRSSNSGSSDPSCSLRDEPDGRIIILADDDFSDGYSTDFVATYHSVSANQKIYAEVMSREIGSYTLTVTRDN